MRLAIVYGGSSFERPVSINTAESIICSINDKYNLIKIDFDGNIASLINTLHKNKITLVYYGNDDNNAHYNATRKKRSRHQLYVLSSL